MSLGYKESFNESAALSQPHEAAKRFVEGQLDAENRQDMNGADPDGGLNGRMRTAASNARLANGNTESEKKKSERMASLMLKLHKLDAEIAALQERLNDLIEERDQLLEEAKQEEAQAGDLDELIKAAEQDGMSDEERRRLKAKLGEKANGKTDAELLELARQERDRLNNSAEDKRRRAEELEGEIDDTRNEIDAKQAERQGVRGELNQLRGAREQAADASLGDDQWGTRMHEASLVAQYGAEGHGDAESQEVKSHAAEADFGDDVIPEDAELGEFMQQVGRFEGIQDETQRQQMQLAIVQMYPELAEEAAKTDPAVAELVELANAETETPTTVAEASPKEEEPTQTASADGGWSISGGMG